MRILSGLITLCFLCFVQASELPTISKDSFQVGQQWVWAYSELDKASGQWLEPYLYEKYTVIKVDGAKVEVEMSSDSTLDGVSEAHHKFKADIDQCLKAGQSEQKMKSWRIAFYTKSFGPQWQLVSSQHQGTPFTEKFNCLSIDKELETEFVTWESELWEIFNPNANGKGSWYFYGHPDLMGVTNKKSFGDYKMELVSIKREDLF